MIKSRVEVNDVEKKLLEVYRRHTEFSKIKYDDDLQTALILNVNKAIIVAVEEWLQTKDVKDKKIETALATSLMKATQFNNKEMLQHIIAHVMVSLDDELESFFRSTKD